MVAAWVWPIFGHGRGSLHFSYTKKLDCIISLYVIVFLLLLLFLVFSSFRVYVSVRGRRLRQRPNRTFPLWICPNVCVCGEEDTQGRSAIIPFQPQPAIERIHTNRPQCHEWTKNAGISLFFVFPSVCGTRKVNLWLKVAVVMMLLAAAVAATSAAVAVIVCQWASARARAKEMRRGRGKFTKVAMESESERWAPAIETIISWLSSSLVLIVVAVAACVHLSKCMSNLIKNLSQAVFENNKKNPQHSQNTASQPAWRSTLAIKSKSNTDPRNVAHLRLHARTQLILWHLKAMAILKLRNTKKHCAADSEERKKNEK